MSGAVSLPSGIVTFLFTDVEGSTRLLERDVASTGDVLRAHVDLLSHSVTEHGGVVFETVGDAVYAAFSRPSGAIAAALDGQRSMHRLHGPDRTPIRVRMAIHIGEVETRDGHYFGPALFRCARILSLAHGGQVLVSAAVAGLAADTLVEGAKLDNLGIVHLRDLDDPEDVYQLAHGDLQSHHPPLRTESAPPAYWVPSTASSLIDRDAELGLLGRLISPGHVVTLTGMAGVGKTRLAIAAASERKELFPAGACLVDCSELDDPKLAELAIAEALGLGGPESWSAERSWVLERLRASFLDGGVLLVLDSADRVAAVGGFLGDLLDACPSVGIVVTSRARLGLQRERVVHIDPLTTRVEPATPGVDRPVAPAIELFVARARSAGAAITDDAATIDVVSAICERLDGLPLAIELVAPLAADRALAELLESLDRGEELPNAAVLDLPARHRTMQAAFGWSLEQLSDPDRRALDELAVLSGSFGAEEAHAIVGEADRDPGIGSFLADLGERSLLRAIGTPGRWLMARTLHRAALQRLDRTREGVAAHRRHAAYFLEVAERLESDRGPAPEISPADLESALSWSAANGDGDIAVRLAGILWRRGQPGGSRSPAASGLASGDLPRLSARPGAESGGLDLHVVRDLGDPRIGALEDMAAAAEAERADDAASAGRLFGQAADRFALAGDDRGSAAALESLAAVVSRSDPAAARSALETAVGIRRAALDLGAVGRDLASLAAIQLDEGDAAAAARAFEETVALWRRTSDRTNEAHAKCGLAICLLELGDADRAGRVLAEVEATARAHSDGALEARYLEARSIALIEAGDLARAGHVIGAARRLSPSPVPPAPWDRTIKRRVSAARRALGAEKWDAVEATGGRLSFDDALDIATRPLS